MCNLGHSVLLTRLLPSHTRVWLPVDLRVKSRLFARLLWVLSDMRPYQVTPNSLSVKKGMHA